MIALFNKIRSAFRRSRRDAEIREELRFHLETEEDERRDAGLSAADARRAARRDLGNVTVIEESTREAWRWTVLERLGQDVNYALRITRRRPGFTAAAILSLTLGIGANVAIFSLLDALLLEQLPVRRPGELVQLVEPARQGINDRFVYATYEPIRDGATRLSSVAVMTDDAESEVIEGGVLHRAVAQLVSANYFSVLGVDAARGRVFHDLPRDSSQLVAVISDGYWRRQFGASESVLGASVQRRALTFSIIGVAPRGFKGVELEAAVDIWFLFDQVVPPNDESRTQGRWVRIVGRLADGATPAQASAEAAALVGRAVTLRRGGTPYSALRLQLNRPLVLVTLVVVLVLAIACTNLANLTYAGNLARERELAVRRALGASRMRLVRQLLTESLLLAVIGGGLALVVAFWMSGALLGFLPPQFAPALADLRLELDARVLMLTALIAIVTTLAIGLLPALYSTRATMSSELRVKAGDGPRTRSWTSRTLIVGEIAACTILLMVAGVLLRSVQNLRGQDAGYMEQQLLVADIGFPGRDDDLRDRKLEELRARIADLPAVQAVAFSHIGQLSGGAFEYRIGFPDQPFSRDGAPQVFEQRVTPGFFRAMGTRLLDGRDISAADTESSPLVAVVNDQFASRFFPGRNPIGQRFFQDGGSRSRQLMEIVGVVQSARWLSLRRTPQPMYYRPYAQQGGTPVVRFAIRGSTEPKALAAAVSAAAVAIDRDVKLANVVPFEEIVNRGLLIERLVASVSSAFAVLALLIAAIGLYGVLAYSVTRRRREIGLRIAVGASPGSVERMFLRESWLLLAAGLAIGVPFAVLITRTVSAMLYGIEPYDPGAIAAVAIVLGAATTAAAFIPARRAAAIDPIIALREE